MKPYFTPMSNLLDEGVNPTSKAFRNLGLAFAKPFLCKNAPRIERAFKALFVCFAGKGGPIEAITNITTPADKAALRRFASR